MVITCSTLFIPTVDNGCCHLSSHTVTCHTRHVNWARTYLTRLSKEEIAQWKDMNLVILILMVILIFLM